MKPQGFLYPCSIFLAILFFFSTSPVASQEVEDEKEFSYEIGSETGPERWGELHEEWSACGKGKLQSPIDLSDERVQVLHQSGPLRSSYHPADAVMKNRGHDIEIKWENQTGGVWINGTKYVLKQLHWHSPSEHTINGRRYSLELHMVHQSADEKIAVVGILYKIGRPDPFLAKMEDYIKKMEDMEESEEEKLGLVDPRDVKKGSRKYYRYMGSLTTPPCTEGVVWTIIRKVRTVAKQQVNLLREAVHDHAEKNARPLQLINDRSLGLYRPRKIRS
ncbi:alpha carbonic anhydrase 7-like [Phoenix dactylifera]|uniref:Carbonic anhydrase n=1 Tax=Phoenix dactylifera TaxID=42345 RepID=A0A8B7CM47_PHODC|nr:alpha carbonic anhydrase 7-like [Phoenix dactylifera]